MNTRSPMKPKPTGPRRRWRMPPLTPGEKKAFYWAGMGLLAAIAIFLVTLPNANDLQSAAPGESIQIFDRNGQMVVTIDGDEEREFTPLSHVPKHVQQAVIAAEDHDFYEHPGISMRGITRAFMSNVSKGRVVEGGSTITQQLAKNLFFESSDRSILRKIREAVMALQIERRYSKEQILEMYFNQVYFGRQAYGLERAAKRYFGKHAQDLNVAEGAFLVGLVKAPSYLGQPENRKAAIERQRVVLNEMKEVGFLTPSQTEEAANAKLAFNRSNSRITKYPYYMSAVQQFLQKNIDRKILDRGGLRVYTNLDQSAQKLAEQTVARRVRAHGGGMNQAALVSVLVEDGSVVALVGGAGDYWEHQWNSATGQHTLGSSFKPFVYLTGFMQGKITPNTIVDDSPIALPQGPGLPMWEPKNFDGQFYGPMSVREALALSRNVAAVRIGMACGTGYVVQTARDAGLKNANLNPTPAVTLGSGSASPLEMAGAYATFARGGTYIEPHLVRRVVSREGFDKEFKPYPHKVFPDFPVRQLVSCMESAVKEGTGTMARLSDRPVAGKTGTTDQARDLWFVGFTPHMVTAVWGGNDQHRSLGGLTGGAVLTGIWKAYNQSYYRAHPTPPGTFYTEQKGNENILQDLLRNPADILKSDEEKERERQQQLNAEQGEQQQEQQGAQQQEAENPFPWFRGPVEQQPQAQQEGEQNNQHNQFVFPLPGQPQPGHVRHPQQPAQNDPFAPRQYRSPQEDPADENYALPPEAPGLPLPAVPRDEAPNTAPAAPSREPQPAPDFRRQRSAEPTPAPEPVPHEQDPGTVNYQ